jgi:hypothetical protein
MTYPIIDLVIAELEGYRDIGQRPCSVEASLVNTNSPYDIAEVEI